MHKKSCRISHLACFYYSDEHNLDNLVWFYDSCFSWTAPVPSRNPCYPFLPQHPSSLTRLTSPPGLSSSPHLSSLPAGHSQLTLRQVCTRMLIGSYPFRRAKKRKFDFPLNWNTQGLSSCWFINKFKSYLQGERRKANRLFHHLRLAFFGKQAKEERIQHKFPQKHQETRLQKDKCIRNQLVIHNIHHVWKQHVFLALNLYQSLVLLA